METTLEASTAFWKAFVAAQAEMPHVEKDGRGNYGAYMTLGTLIEKTRPILSKHGLAVVQAPGHDEEGEPVLHTLIVHAESGETLTSTMKLAVSKSDMQGLGSAITYARRYAWGAMLGIASEEDDDGASATPKAAPARRQPSRRRDPDPDPEPARQAPGATQEQVDYLRSLLNDAGVASDRIEEGFVVAARANGGVLPEMFVASKITYYEAERASKVASEAGERDIEREAEGLAEVAAETGATPLEVEDASVASPE